MRVITSSEITGDAHRRKPFARVRVYNEHIVLPGRVTAPPLAPPGAGVTRGLVCGQAETPWQDPRPIKSTRQESLPAQPPRPQ